MFIQASFWLIRRIVEKIPLSRMRLRLCSSASPLDREPLSFGSLTDEENIDQQSLWGAGAITSASPPHPDD